MIKRLWNFKWYMMVIVVVTIIFVGWFKVANGLFGYSRFVPAFFTNAYFNHVNQNIQRSRGTDERIVFVEIPFCSSDSLIGVVVKQAARFRPRVIAIDFFPLDLGLTPFTLDPVVDIVMATPIIENDSILKPVNIFNQNVYYSHVAGKNSITTTFDPRIQSLPVKVVELFDPAAYNRLQQRRIDEEIINYDLNASLLILPYEQLMDTTTFMPDYLRDKIILVGGMGGSISGQPEILDNTDVHDTPVGRQFGTVVLYHEIRTLLGNFIDPASAIVDYGLLAFVVLIQVLFVFAISHLNKKVVYVAQKTMMILSVALVSAIGVQLFYHFRYLSIIKHVAWEQ